MSSNTEDIAFIHADLKHEARRLLLQGAVRVNGEKLIGLGKVHLTDGAVLKVGKLKMAKLSIR
jgi:tyrosyl-tRNA synthetase